MIGHWRAARRERQRVALVELVRWAQEQQSDGARFRAGPTTDAATVATRVFNTGRVRVRL